MTGPKVTLGSVFSVEEAKARWSAGESPKSLASPKESSSESGEINWSVASDAVMSKLDDVLDVDLAAVMATAWSRAELLRKYLDPKTYDSDETILLSLAEHSVHSTHHPSIEVLINNKKVSSVSLEIDVELVIDGLVLKIEHGSITEIQTGSCQVTGSLKCAGVLIAEEQSKSISLPGVVRFEEGIQIGRR